MKKNLTKKLLVVLWAISLMVSFVVPSFAANDECPGHSLQEYVTEPTCTEPGIQSYWKCDSCGKMYSDSEGQNEISETTAVPAAGHTLELIKGYPASCTTEGFSDYYKCTKCWKKFSDAEGENEIEQTSIIPPSHNLTHHPAIAATETEMGVIEYWSCSDCGSEFRDLQAQDEIYVIYGNEKNTPTLTSVAMSEALNKLNELENTYSKSDYSSLAYPQIYTIFNESRNAIYAMTTIAEIEKFDFDAIKEQANAVFTLEQEIRLEDAIKQFLSLNKDDVFEIEEKDAVSESALRAALKKQVMAKVISQVEGSEDIVDGIIVHLNSYHPGEDGSIVNEFEFYLMGVNVSTDTSVKINGIVKNNTVIQDAIAALTEQIKDANFEVYEEYATSKETVEAELLKQIKEILQKKVENGSNLSDLISVKLTKYKTIGGEEEIYSDFEFRIYISKSGDNVNENLKGSVVAQPMSADTWIEVAGIEGGKIKFKDGVITDAEKTITKANIPSQINGQDVTTLEYSFNDCTKLTDVTIPDTVKYVFYAFNGCTSLKTVNLGKNVEAFGGMVRFFNCTSLTQINVDPENKNFTFKNGGLYSGDMLIWLPSNGSTKVVVPEGTKKLGTGFAPFMNLNSVVIPKSVEVISFGAFEGALYIEEIYYAGTEEEWNSLEKYIGTFYTLYFNSQTEFAPAENVVVVGTSSTNPTISANTAQTLFTQEDKDSGKDLKVGLSVNEVKEENLPEEEKKALDKIKSDYNIGMILDIDLTKYVGDNSTGLTDLNEEIEITIAIPKDMQGKGLVIVRIHNGEVEVLEDIDNNPATFTFKTNKFSTYALAEVNKEATITKPAVNATTTNTTTVNAPATGDGTPIMLVFMLMAVSFIILFDSAKKKIRKII